mgnify:FL=1
MPKCLLIKNADLYAPEPLGRQDILMIGEQEALVAPEISGGVPGLETEVIDAAGRKVIPGYVDQHVHIIGGGGESGPYSRTPEVQLSAVTTAGVTTVVGVLGTDGTTRHLESLLAKARALDTEGITAYILTGSYEVPLNTILSDARRDIIVIDKVLGIGEVSISDHRSSLPSRDEIKRIASQARLGGMLSGKAGVLQFHMGSGKAGLTEVFAVLDETEIPAKHFIPTHVNRDEGLFRQAMDLARRGGYMDITSGIRKKDGFSGGIEPSVAIRMCWEAGVPMDHVTMSSDGNGGMSLTLPDGSQKLLVAQLASLHEEVRDAVLTEGVPLETAIRVAGENPARANGLWPRKGTIRPDSDGDLLILDEEMHIDTVVARGRVMVRDGKAVVKGTYEP